MQKLQPNQKTVLVQIAWAKDNWDKIKKVAIKVKKKPSALVRETVEDKYLKI